MSTERQLERELKRYEDAAFERSLRFLRGRDAYERKQGAIRRKSRRKLVSDRAAAMRATIRAMHRDDRSLEWETLATRMRLDVPGCESLSEKTLRRWATELELPHPADEWWRA